MRAKIIEGGLEIVLPFEDSSLYILDSRRWIPIRPYSQRCNAISNITQSTLVCKQLKRADVRTLEVVQIDRDFVSFLFFAKVLSPIFVRNCFSIMPSNIKEHFSYICTFSVWISNSKMIRIGLDLVAFNISK